MSRKNKRKSNDQINDRQLVPKTTTSKVKVNDSNQLFDHFIFISLAVFLSLVPLVFNPSVYQSFSLVKAYVYKFAMGIIIVVWCARMISTRWGYDNIRRSFPLAISLLLFGVFTAFSTLFGIDPWISLVGIYTRQIGLQGILTGIFIYFILCSTMKKRVDVEFLLKMFLVVGLIVGVYATFQFFGMDFFKWVKRPYDKVPSMAGNANLCGNILALLFPIGLYFIFKAKNRALKILSILSTVFILLGVLFSQSRAIWLTVLVTVVFIIFVTLIIHREIIARHKKLYIISIACVLSITHFLVNSFIIMRYSNTLFLIISLMGHALIFSIWNMQERWTKIKIKFSSIIYLIILLCTFALSLTIKIQYSAPETFGHKYFSTFHFEKIPRYFLFRDSTYVIKDHFFFGTGEGTYRIAYMPYKSIENEIAEPKANYDSPHNNYLTVWATQGVFAFIAYMSIIFIFFRGAFKTISSTTVNRDDKLLMGTLLASFFAYLLWSLTSFDSNVTNPIMIGLFASFSVLLYLIRRDEITVESKYASKIIMVCKGFMILLIPLAILSIITVQKLYNADQHYAKTVRFKNTAIKYLNKKEKEKAVKIMSMARREANKAISMNPRESFYHVEMADIHFNLFKLTGAKHHIQETYKFLKNSREHDWDPGKYYLVKMKLELSQGNKNEAIRYAESVLKDLPYNFIVRSQLGYLLFQRRTAKAFKKALEHFRITLRIKPNNLVSLVYTSEIYLRFGKFNLARQFANKAMVAHPSRKKQLIGLLQKINKSEEQLKKSAKNKS